MRFRFIRKVLDTVVTYEGQRVATGDVVTFADRWFEIKALTNDDFEIFSEPMERTVDELRAFLDVAGVAVDRRWGRKRLERMVSEIGE